MSSDGFDIVTDTWTDCPEIPGWKIRPHLLEDGFWAVGLWNGVTGEKAYRTAVRLKEAADEADAVTIAMPTLADCADEHARKEAGVSYMEWLERKLAA